MIDRINFALSTLYARLQAEEGQTMVEYGLILALIVGVSIAALSLIGGGIHSDLQSICTSMKISGSC